VSAIESATAGDGYEVREGTQVVSDDTGYYGGVVSLAEDGGHVVAAVACDDGVLRAFDVEYLSVFTDQGG
jgi:hypothetical protein